MRYARAMSQRASQQGVRVELTFRREGATTVVGVRALRSRRVLFACGGNDRASIEFAVLACERYCAERGYVRVMRPANDVAPKAASESAA